MLAFWQVAKLYGVPVILHTDHCQKSWLPWFDGLIEASEEYFEKNGEPLFSSHMLDLSEESLEDNISICKKYLERMAKINLLLEMELGVTGGEEDGVDNTDVDSSRLYTQPEESHSSHMLVDWLMVCPGLVSSHSVEICKVGTVRQTTIVTKLSP